MAEQQLIQVFLQTPQGRAYRDCNNNEKAVSMAPELEAFNKYMRELPPENGGGALAPLEMTLIRTYLAWKLRDVPQTNAGT